MKLIVALILAGASSAPASDIRLPALISDNMVLQQQMPVRIWGMAQPGERVSVAVAGYSAAPKANADGRWEAFLPPMPAGGPYDLTITAGRTVTLRNVLIGEVWVASGQSNMAWTVDRSAQADKEIPLANDPQIRFFQTPTTVAEQPAEDVPNAAWKICTPENAAKFSAVAYFFARELRRARGVPIGILQSAVGGTPAQAWTSRPALEANPRLHYYLEQWQQRVAEYPAAKAKYDQALAQWKRLAEQARREGKEAPRPPQMPLGGPGHTHTPSGLYNGMIAPLTPYAIRGAIWYQGESNAGSTDNELYRYLFAEMILDWRRAWAQGPFPFLFVQLASFEPPEGRQWPILRDSQTRTLELANTAMAVAIDIGESNDIHPKNKQDVGRRLALAARAVAYGENIVYSGPHFRQLTKEDGALRVWFSHTGSGLAARGGPPITGFRIAGEDGRFFKAEARIEGDSVVVASPMVTEPVAVRYAWENDPVANLINREGLPAVPFRTDSWK